MSSYIPTHNAALCLTRFTLYSTPKMYGERTARARTMGEQTPEDTTPYGLAGGLEWLLPIRILILRDDKRPAARAWGKSESS